MTRTVVLFNRTLLIVGRKAISVGKGDAVNCTTRLAIISRYDLWIASCMYIRSRSSCMHAETFFSGSSHRLMWRDTYAPSQQRLNGWGHE